MRPPQARGWAGTFVAVSVLLLSACATVFTQKETVGYDAAVAGDFSSRPGPASLTRDSEKSLLDRGYFKLGRISVVQVISTDGAEVAHADTPTNRATREAAARGADVLRLDKNQTRHTDIRYKTGACLRFRTEYVTVPTYEQECRSSSGGVVFCSQRQSGSRVQSREVCAKHEQIPYSHITLFSEGTIWRHDPPRIAADRALLKALTTGPAATLEQLLAQHPSIETPLLDGRKPLRVAVAAGNANAVRLLLGRGAKPELSDLRLATEQGHDAVARLLIQHGPATGGDKAADQSALWSASVLGQTSVVEALLARGMDFKLLDNADGQNALHKAAWACRPGTVKLLIARGADPKATTKDGERAIDLARSSATWSKRTPAEQAACREIVMLLGP